MLVCLSCIYRIDGITTCIIYMMYHDVRFSYMAVSVIWTHSCVLRCRVPNLRCMTILFSSPILWICLQTYDDVYYRIIYIYNHLQFVCYVISIYIYICIIYINKQYLFICVSSTSYYSAVLTQRIPSIHEDRAAMLKEKESTGDSANHGRIEQCWKPWLVVWYRLYRVVKGGGGC